MADINQQFVNEICNNMLKPTIVDTMVFNGNYKLYNSAGYFSNKSAKYTLKFIGYALPTCTGMAEPKWLIQLNVKIDINSDEGTTDDGGSNGGIDLIVEDTYQQRSIIGFANGVRNFDQPWTYRMRLAYKIAKGASPFYQDGVLLGDIFQEGERPEYELPSGVGGNEQQM